MDTFNKLTAHLRQHVWCLVALAALLIFWLGAFSLAGKGSDIASWVSILFAVVVIVYMVIQGHEMRNLVEEGHRLMAEKAGTMADTAGEIAKKTELISELMVRIFKAPETPHVQPSAVEPFETDKLRFNASCGSEFTLLTLYAAVQSCIVSKPMAISKIAAYISAPELHDQKDQENRNRIISYSMYGVLGILQTIACFLEPNSLIYGAGANMEIKNLPTGFEKHISKELIKRAKEPSFSPVYKDFIETCRRNIVAYFEKS